MQRLGVESLSEAELVSLLLGGKRERSLEAAAAALVADGLAPLRVLKSGAHNLGPRVQSAHLERIRVALELGRRALMAVPPEQLELKSPAAICAHLLPRLAHLEREEFWAILLSVRLEELHTIRISLGGIAHCSLLPREAFSAAVLHGAPCIAFAHNHPSGDPEPSTDDRRLQTQLDEAGRALGIDVVDHFVITARGHHSSRHGLLSLDGQPIPEPPDDSTLESTSPNPDRFQGRQPLMSDTSMSSLAEVPADSQTLHRALREHFGYDAFRPAQEDIVRSVLSGKPTIAILPTGGGKSLCFQLPALLLPGTTVVVSPLVALMKDQVDALNARGIPATFINSSLGEHERAERQAALRRGAWRLVYVAPERFRSGSFAQAMTGVRCPLLAVDEAHCISSWGHDFRPDYQRLAQARTQLRAERVLALTATATPEVRRDIADALELREPTIFVAGFDRPNLFIEVARVSGDKEKLGRLFALARKGEPGLIYAATRKNVEKVVAALMSAGLPARGYHAGMDDAERSDVQDAFLQGRTPVVVATNAFGMGVDKPDIRFVAHFDVPRSVEAYYQEIGRAGRDGLASLAVLLFNYADVLMQRRIIDGNAADPSLVRRIWEDARAAPEGHSSALARSAGVHLNEVQAALKLLEAAGHLERRRSSGTDYLVITPHVGPAALEVPFELAAQRVAHERQMLDRLVRFADTASCRRQNLLRYFGDRAAQATCGSCDVCIGSRAPVAEEMAGTTARKRSPKAAGATATPVLAGPYDAQVFSGLRALRTELARSLRVPPYVIFHDATLMELARALPESEQDFLAVKGAGPGRWEKYGEKVLAVTAPAARRAREQPASSSAAEQTPVASERDEEVARYHEGVKRRPLQRPLPAAGDPPEWLSHGPGAAPPTPAGATAAEAAWLSTWSLYGQGLSLGQIAARRGESVSAVAALLAEALMCGKPIDAHKLLDPGLLEEVGRLAAQGDDNLVALRNRLVSRPSFGELRLALVAQAVASRPLHQAT